MINFTSTTPPDNNTIVTAVKDFGFHHPLPEVQRMYAEYVNNKKYWYGENGVDQPDEYWEDIATMNWLNLYIKHVLPQAQAQEQMSQEDVITRLRKGGKLNG